MDTIDLNLLHALDALLAEESVSGAALRMGVSTSAMSRTLTRLRQVTGDPLLVRAGRVLAPTPHAIALRQRVHQLTREAGQILQPATADLDIATLRRTFHIRANEGFISLFAAPLAIAVTEAAPGVCLRFVAKPRKDAGALRNGEIDLDIGVPGIPAPELRRQTLFKDRFVGAARIHHPLFDAQITPARYAACRHVVASRKGVAAVPVDTALAALGLARDIRVVVPGFPDAMRLARESDLVALVPGACIGRAPASAASDAAGLAAFELPVSTPSLVIEATWHPRMDADPAHRWLRAQVVQLCTAMTSAA